MAVPQKSPETPPVKAEVAQGPVIRGKCRDVIPASEVQQQVVGAVQKKEARKLSFKRKNPVTGEMELVELDSAQYAECVADGTFDPEAIIEADPTGAGPLVAAAAAGGLSGGAAVAVAGSAVAVGAVASSGSGGGGSTGGSTPPPPAPPAPVNIRPSVQSLELLLDQGEVNQGAVTADDPDAGPNDTLRFALTGAAPEGLTFNADGTFVFDASSYAFLAAGQTRTITVNYVATDAQGGVSEPGVLRFTITGTNDGVTLILTDSVLEGTATEDAATAGPVGSSGTASGVVAFNDVDLTDTHQASFTAAAGQPVLGTFRLGVVSESATTASGSVPWSFTLDDAAVQSLTAGQQVTQSFTVTVVDAFGARFSQVVTVTVVGTNDVPQLPSAQAALAEGGTTSGRLVGSDADLGETATLSYSLVGPAIDGLTLNADGRYAFDASIGAYDGLKQGETRVVTASVRATDAQGQASVPGELSFTITGSNDLPTVIDNEAQVAQGQTVRGQVTGGDADLGEAATLTFALLDPLPAGLAFMSDGSFDYTDVSDGSAAQGQMQTVTVRFMATDVQGGRSQPGTLTLTRVGLNDAPAVVVAGSTLDGALVEDDPAPLSVTGQVLASDIDVGDGRQFFVDAQLAVVRYRAAGTSVDTAAPEGLDAAVAAPFEVDPDTGTWTYEASGLNLDALGAGDVLTLSYTVVVEDTNGLQDSTVVTVTITGANDAPTVEADGVSDSVLTGMVQEADQDAATADLLVATGRVLAIDVDAGDGTTVELDLVRPVTLAYRAADASEFENIASFPGLDLPALTAAFSVAPDGQWTFDASALDLDVLAEFDELRLTFPVVVVDAAGAEAASSVVVTLLGRNDAPVVLADASVVTGALVEDVSTGERQYEVIVDGQPVQAVEAVIAVTGQLQFEDRDVRDALVASVSTNGVGGVAVQALFSGRIGGEVFTRLDVPDDVLPLDFKAAFDVTDSGLWTYDATYLNFQLLGEGDTLELTFNVTVTDRLGATGSTPVSVTLSGANDAPVVIDRTVALATGDQDPATEGFQLNLNPEIRTVEDLASRFVADPDLLSPDLVFSLAADQAAEGQYGTVILGADGQLSYLVDPGRVALGGPLTELIHYEVVDGSGAMDDGFLTIDLNTSPMAV